MAPAVALAAGLVHAAPPNPSGMSLDAPDNAIAALSRAVAERPDDVRCPLALARACLAAQSPQQANVVLTEALDRFPDHVELTLAWIDAALAQGCYATALDRVRTAQAKTHDTPELRLRAAQAYFQLGQVLGEAEVRAVPDGRAGQFVGNWLLVEPREGPDRFLCCPPASALYQLRQALDAGLDEPAAHVLHARIWQRIGRPQIGLAILKSRAAVLLARPGEDVLATFSDLALEAGAMPDFLRYERLRADRQPERREEILLAACLTAAEQYSQRGEGGLCIQWLSRAVRIRPNDTGVILRLADAEWAGGQPDLATPLYQRVLSLEPAHPERGRILSNLAQTPTAEP